MKRIPKHFQKNRNPKQALPHKKQTNTHRLKKKEIKNVAVAASNYKI